MEGYLNMTTEMPNLSPVQQKVIKFLLKYKQKNFANPIKQEILNGTGITLPTLNRALKGLAVLEYIKEVKIKDDQQKNIGDKRSKAVVLLEDNFLTTKDVVHSISTESFDSEGTAEVLHENAQMTTIIQKFFLFLNDSEVKIMLGETLDKFLDYELTSDEYTRVNQIVKPIFAQREDN